MENNIFALKTTDLIFRGVRRLLEATNYKDVAWGKRICRKPVNKVTILRGVAADDGQASIARRCGASERAPVHEDFHKPANGR